MSATGKSARQRAYRRLLSNVLWRDFRLHVIEADGGLCRRCGRGEEQNALLQVHHVSYIQGKLPWQYPLALLETLCAGCHAREHGIIPPVDGWDFILEADLGDLCGECEYCGTAIRYTFLIHHPKWEPMEVGTICCDRLTGTIAASLFQRRIERRDRFAESPRWRHVTADAWAIKQQSIVVATVLGKAGGWLVMMNGHMGRVLHPSETAARVAAFDAIESGRAEAWLASKTVAA